MNQRKKRHEVIMNREHQIRIKGAKSMQFKELAPEEFIHKFKNQFPKLKKVMPMVLPTI